MPLLLVGCFILDYVTTKFLREPRLSGLLHKSDTNEDETDQEVHNVLSQALVHQASATSSVVPVFVSSDKDSEKEILT